MEVSLVAIWGWFNFEAGIWKPAYNGLASCWTGSSLHMYFTLEWINKWYRYSPEYTCSLPVWIACKALVYYFEYYWPPCKISAQRFVKQPCFGFLKEQSSCISLQVLWWVMNSPQLSFLFFYVIPHNVFIQRKYLKFSIKRYWLSDCNEQSRFKGSFVHSFNRIKQAFCNPTQSTRSI